jgi:hypothetical protein
MQFAVGMSLLTAFTTYAVPSANAFSPAVKMFSSSLFTLQAKANNKRSKPTRCAWPHQVPPRKSYDKRLDVT